MRMPGGEFDNPTAALRGNQLVCAALLLGQLMYGIVIAVVHATESFDPQMEQEIAKLFIPIGIAAGVLAVPVSFGLRSAIWRRGAQGGDEMVMNLFFAGNIVFQAVLEGVSFLNLTFWLITGEALPYVLLSAMLFILGIAGFPRPRA